MGRTVLPSAQALQVLLRHIENIYLSQAGMQKTNYLEGPITNSLLCCALQSSYTRLIARSNP